MKYKSTDRVKILEYKFIFEEVKQVKNEYEQGSADLNYRLSFFREKLDNKGASNQRKRYDNMFMGGFSEISDTAELTNIQDIAESAPKPNDNIELWAKKLYRQIVMVTHPDKISDIQAQHLKEQLCNQYRVVQNAYQRAIYSDLIMTAFDLNIEIPDNVVEKYINSSLTKKKKDINQVKKLIGWQWFHVPESQRDAELKKILMYQGFRFTDDQVRDVVKQKYIKRKIGTRPEKINVKRRRLK